MKYTVIATGSKGNCLLVYDGPFMVDIGAPFKALRGYLPEIKGRAPGVFLTHKHRDHFSSVTAQALMMEHPGTVLFTPEKMVEDVKRAVGDRFFRNVFSVESNVIYTAGNGDCTINFIAQDTFHDAPNVCWHIAITNKETGKTEKMFYATDTGHLEGISAKGYDYYFIEGNHTREELEGRAREKLGRGQYAYEIRAAANHLSVEQALDFIAENAGPESKYILMHEHVEEEKPKTGIDKQF